MFFLARYILNNLQLKMSLDCRHDRLTGMLTLVQITQANISVAKIREH